MQKPTHALHPSILYRSKSPHSGILSHVVQQCSMTVSISFLKTVSGMFVLSPSSGTFLTTQVIYEYCSNFLSIVWEPFVSDNIILIKKNLWHKFYPLGRL